MQCHTRPRTAVQLEAKRTAGAGMADAQVGPRPAHSTASAGPPARIHEKPNDIAAHPQKCAAHVYADLLESKNASHHVWLPWMPLVTGLGQAVLSPTQQCTCRCSLMLPLPKAHTSAKLHNPPHAPGAGSQSWSRQR